MKFQISRVVDLELDSLTELIVTETEVPDTQASRRFLKVALVYMERKYGFIQKMTRLRQIDDGVCYGDGK